MTEPRESAFVRITRDDELALGDLVGRCFETGTAALLIEDGALPAAFFDLSTGIAGDVVQKVTMYHLRMAVVVPDLSVHSAHFRDFAREAARGASFRFFQSAEEAASWLEAS